MGLHHSPVRAQVSTALDAGADPDAALSPPGITVTVRGQAPAAGAAKTYGDTQVTQDEIEREMPLGLADAMRHAPSASVQQTSPSQATIYVRGASGRELSHMVDGVRLNSTIFRAGNNPFIGLVDVYSLERVEIKPGANSVHYGADAMGGAVLMWTRVPNLSEAGPSWSARLLQTLSSNPLGGASRADASHSTHDWALRVGATRIEAGAIAPGQDRRSPLPASYVGAQREPGTKFRPAFVRDQVGTEFQQLGADATLHVRLPARLALLVRGQHSVAPNVLRYDQITPRFKNELPDRAESSLTPLRRSMVSLELTGRAPPHEVPSSSLILSWQRLSERAHFRNLAELCTDQSIGEDADCSVSSILLRDPKRSIEHNRTDAFGVAGRTRFDLGRLTLATGAGVHHEVVSSKTFTELGGVLEKEPASPRFPDGSTATEAGVFAMPTLALGDSVSLSVGGRATAYHVAIAARGGENSAPETDLTLLDWSGQALIEWRPVRGLAIGASWGRALRPPNVQDLATQGTRARGRYQVPNDSLGAEHAQSTDFGLRFRRRGAHLQTTIFYQRNSDAIVLAPTSVGGQPTSPEGDVYYSSLNASSVESYGVEAQGRLQLHQFFAPFSRFLAMQGQQRNPPGTGLPASTPADRTPPVQGELGFRSHLGKSIVAELMAAYRLRQDRLNDPINVEDNRIPEGGTPGFVSYHARIDWRARRWLRARLNFDNLSDELILEHGSGFYRPGFAVTGMLELMLDDARAWGSAR
jgi:outer membrane receptor protein involved in Fe transport